MTDTPALPSLNLQDIANLIAGAKAGLGSLNDVDAINVAMSIKAVRAVLTAPSPAAEKAPDHG